MGGLAGAVLAEPRNLPVAVIGSAMLVLLGVAVRVFVPPARNMILLDADQLRKRFGPEPVLEGVTFELSRATAAGLVGPNGCGKTTLLRILAGKDEADLGSCRVHPAAHLGYLEQQPQFQPDRTLHAEAQSALADLLSLQQEAVEVSERSRPPSIRPSRSGWPPATTTSSTNSTARTPTTSTIASGGCWTGAVPPRNVRPAVCRLSGGEQNRLMLAKLLLAEPNVMLLDEPSNHLDLEATEWLEQFLLESSAARSVEPRPLFSSTAGKFHDGARESLARPWATVQ